MKKKVFVFITVFLASSIVGYLLFQEVFSPKQCDDKNKNEATVPQNASIVIQNLTLREVEKSKGYELIVNAQQSTFHHISEVVECKNVSCKIMQKGLALANIHAQKSFVDRTSKHVLFSGDVKGNFKDLIIDGSDICYNFSTQTVGTDNKITYTHPLFNFSANKSTINIKTNTIEMGKGVYSEFLYRAATDKSGK